MKSWQRTFEYAVLIVTTLAVHAPVGAWAEKPAHAQVFLRQNRIHVRIPGGPTYAAEVNSPVYEEYMEARAVDCVKAPVLRSDPKKVGIFYKTSRGADLGIVRFELLVNPEGRVEAVQLRESAGAFAAYSVLAAVVQWEFEPGQADDAPAYCRMSHAYNFVSES